MHLEIRRFVLRPSPSVPLHTSILRLDGLFSGPVHLSQSTHPSRDYTDQYIRPTPHTHLEIIRFAQETCPSVPVHTSILRLDGLFSGPVHLSQSTHPSRDYTVCTRHLSICLTPYIHLEIRRFVLRTSPSVPVHSSISRLDGLFSGPVHLSHSLHLS
ncbi:hypothetical protein RRG08_055024 [Elysia crispata]|uniref:Uncharacterized protein n=1 Tax=Elysia crispata TaxID=231223 RepID=A0AAE1CLD0_9GAST|nr:hypothetical protein RRG08_055024 [Elysia crispata]